MKQIFRYALTISAVVATALFSSCGEDDSTENNGELSFGFSVQDESGRILDDVELSSIIVSIEEISGSMIFEDEEIALSNFEGDYESDPISLIPGEYNLTKFVVVGEDDQVYYATPLQNSDLAYLVDSPLPINLIVSKDEVTHVVPEVISTREGTVEDFGYGEFGFEFVETFDLLISIFVYDESTNQYELTTANLSIYNESDSVTSAELYATTNKIVLSDRFDFLTIEVSKETYQTSSHVFSLDSLQQYDGTTELGPLEIILEPIAGTVDLANGLIAYYPFNGNANDESVNANDGDVQGPTMVADRNGVANAAYSFDGVDDYIELGNSDVFALGEYTEFSVSIWTKSEAVFNNSNGVLFSKYISASDNRFYAFSYYGDSLTTSLSIYENGASSNVERLYTSTDNEWHNIVWTFNNNVATIYVDGAMLGTATFSFPIKTGTTTANAVIGATHFSSSHYDLNFTGLIDDIRIYNRELLTSEVDAISSE